VSTGKVIKLTSLSGVVCDEPSVVQVLLAKGVALCGWSAAAGTGGALQLPESIENSGMMKLVRDWLLKMSAAAGPGNGLEFKLICVGCDLEKARSVCQLLQIKLVGELSEKLPVEAYFYTDIGRLRVAEIENSSKPVPDSSSKKKRVLVVDDSKTIRQLLTRILNSDPQLEVVGAAELPSQAKRLIAELRPDVITLDINMPEMDGVTLLKQYITDYPIPTVMISAISMEEGNLVLQAMEYGAVDYIQKPSFEEIDRMAPLIIEKVKIAASVRVRLKQASSHVKSPAISGKLNQKVIVAIGSSTGGTEALRVFFTKLPAGIPPMIVVQHIPPVFSKAFANRLAELCAFEVKEAEDGDLVQPDRVLIAPGGMQLKLVTCSSGYKVSVFDGAAVNRHKPSVDVLFDSVSELIGKNAIGIIMTGMGKDGAAGLLKMRKAGARTIAQDEHSCVVFGMPKEAIKLGAAEVIEPLEEISTVLTKWLATEK